MRNDMPQAMQASAAAVVNTTYTQNRALAISFTRGTFRSDVGPVLSALNI